MANRKTRRDLAKNFPPAFIVTDVTDGVEYSLHIASKDGRPVLVIHEDESIVMAIPALQVVQAVATMIEEAYEKIAK